MFLKTGSAMAALLAVASAQQVGTNDAETHPKITWQKCTASSCTNVNGEMVIDSNWRWAHAVGGYTNCYDGNTWNATACPNQEACAKNCAIEGAKYSETYGVTTSGNGVTMKFSTKHQYGTNIGSRLYLMNGASKYQMFTMNGNEIAFDVENSKLGCGLNGAVYFVSMDEDGGMAKYPNNKAGAKYGTGYCDSQCARDLKWIAGKGNVKDWVTGTDPNSGVGEMGACCAEMDLWEANSHSFALTPHPCQNNAYHVCTGSGCGGTYSEERYNGDCDPDGCDLNPFRHGNTDFYGAGKTVDTTKKFTVVTQFHGSGSKLDSISQYFIQNGKRIEVPGSKVVPDGQSITPGFCSAAKSAFGDNERFSDVGGLAKMGEATGKPMVLVVSIWDDGYSHMKWLDGERFPLDRDPSEPGVARGDCPTEGSEPDTVRETQKNAQVTYSNFKFGPIGSTYKL